MALAAALDYDRLSELLMAVELAPSPSEAQGMLCGLLALHLPDPLERWHAQLSPVSAADADREPQAALDTLPPPTPVDLTNQGRASPLGERQHECAHDLHHEHGEDCSGPHDHADLDIDADERRTALDQLAATTQASTEPPSVSFDLLLPPDERPLRIRARAVLDWVRGLLFGLALGGLERDQLFGQAGEAFDDLVELTRMDVEAVADNDTDEQALTEIVEFLRIAAMLILEDRAKALIDGRDRHAAETGLH
jgi:uncharacterized protein YgfB (UPF0149 family)